MRHALFAGFGLVNVGCVAEPAAVREPAVVSIARVVSSSDERTASAGQTGCAPNDVSVHEQHHDLGVESWTAICRGKTFICSRENGNTSCVASTPETPAAPGEDPNQTRRVVRSAYARSKEPQGAAGFSLDATVQETQQACEGSGKEWTQTTKGYRCSGTPQAVGKGVVAFLRFCDEKLCGIELRGRPEGEATNTWIHSFAEYSKALTAKYGGASVEERTFPTRCKGKLVKCLRSGDAEFIFTWSWESGARMALSMTQVGKEPTIRIAYRRYAKERPDDAEKIDPSSL